MLRISIKGSETSCSCLGFSESGSAGGGVTGGGEVVVILGARLAALGSITVHRLTFFYGPAVFLARPCEFFARVGGLPRVSYIRTGTDFVS